MLTLLAEENFNNDFVRGVRPRHPAVDLVLVWIVDLGMAAKAVSCTERYHPAAVD